MTSIHSKIFEMFKNLKSDAMPKPPRPGRPETAQDPPDADLNDENIDSTNEPEEIIVESDESDHEATKNGKPKFKKSFFKSNKKDGKSGKTDKTGSSNVNTQATGNVINIVNSTHVRWGNDYFMGSTNMKPPTNTNFKNAQDKEEPIEKSNLIMLLLEAKIKPEHVFIDYVSKNLGKNWHSFFRTLGFSKGAIETKEIDTASYGVSEARYKLLIDWMNDDADGSRTLGRLANFLWEEGERELVKELALLYKKANGKN